MHPQFFAICPTPLYFLYDTHRTSSRQHFSLVAPVNPSRTNQPEQRQLTYSDEPWAIQ